MKSDECATCPVRLEWLAIQMRHPRAPDYLGQLADREATIQTLRLVNLQLLERLAGVAVAGLLARIGGTNETDL
jgi:hypothetical protein